MTLPRLTGDLVRSGDLEWTVTADAAPITISPRVAGPCSVLLGQAAYRLRYAIDHSGFTLVNLADTERTFVVELPGRARETVTIAAGATLQKTFV